MTVQEATIDQRPTLLSSHSHSCDQTLDKEKNGQNDSIAAQ